MSKDMRGKGKEGLPSELFLQYYYNQVQSIEESGRILYDIMLDTEVKGGRVDKMRSALCKMEEYYEPVMSKSVQKVKKDKEDYFT